MADTFLHAEDYLGSAGSFCQQIPGFQVRENQLALCHAIVEAIEKQGVLTAEAGTGIGKTFAYLVPALLSEHKVIISTGTRHLQDQLFRTDLPRVLKALALNTKTALLKGRSNYLCLHRLKLAPHLGFINRETAALLTSIGQWSKQTTSGDIAELNQIPEDSYVWPMVTSTTDNCLGGDCDYWADCFIVKQRKKAQDADLLVINHHLLLADMTLKDEGFAELLPTAEAYIIDEAHQLYDVAARFFGTTVSSRQLTSLARDTIAEQVNDAPDMAELRDYAENLETAAKDFRLVLGEAGLREAWLRVQYKSSVDKGVHRLHGALEDLLKVLQLAADRSRGLDQCCERCAIVLQQLTRFLLPNSVDAQAANHQTSSNQTVSNQTSSNQAASSQAASTDTDVLWYETFSRSFMLHSTPVEVADLFQQHTGKFEKAWIFTSATLQVNQDFTHFTENIGIDSQAEKYHSGVWESPFDYQKQSLLYLPAGLPQPSASEYTRCFIDAALPVLAASQGRAFLLFTSYRAMHTAFEMLKTSVSYPLFVQGDLPKHQLLEKFRTTDNAVLLGTASFWEGVDVRGSALSCVIIDKLPFASPGDPVMQARIDVIKKKGGNAFMSFQVPQAVITLKQGVGRLIRDVKDRGVVMIGDPRISQKAYGRLFINSLPAMPVCTDIKQVSHFFQQAEVAHCEALTE